MEHNEAARIKGPLMVEGDFAPRSRIRQHLKDVRLMLDSAGAAALELPFSRVHAQLLEEAVAHGEGELDNAAILLSKSPIGVEPPQEAAIVVGWARVFGRSARIDDFRLPCHHAASGRQALIKSTSSLMKRIEESAVAA